MKPIRVLSLCDGISCGMVALIRAGFQIEEYVAYEIDKTAIAISEKNFPMIKHMGDVRNADFSQYKGYEFVIGGTPCQDLSGANQKGKGLNGDRSSLFWEFKRAVEEVKPKYFLLENVATMSEADRQMISFAMGCEPIMINSALVSAQSRKRYYWTNIPVEQPKDKGIYLKDVCEDESAVSCALRTRKDYIGSSKHLEVRKDGKENAITTVATDSMKLKPIRIGSLYENNSQGGRIYSINGKSVTLQAQSGGLGAKTGLYRVDLPDGDYVVRRLSETECERLQTLPDGYTDGLGLSWSKRVKPIGNGWTVDVIAHIFKAMAEQWG